MEMAINLQKATFATGCFWGTEAAFAQTEGVFNTLVGYTGGSLCHPSYQEVCTGSTGHAEAIELTFDPLKLTYIQLLNIFWASHDPTTLNRQGPDVGTQYRSSIFFHDEEQQVLAEKSRILLDQSDVFSQPIVTQIIKANTFYQAEEYHQQYFLKNPWRACHTLNRHRYLKIQSLFENLLSS